MFQQARRILRSYKTLRHVCEIFWAAARLLLTAEYCAQTTLCAASKGLGAGSSATNRLPDRPDPTYLPEPPRRSVSCFPLACGLKFEPPFVWKKLGSSDGVPAMSIQNLQRQSRARLGSHSGAHDIRCIVYGQHPEPRPWSMEAFTSMRVPNARSTRILRHFSEAHSLAPPVFAQWQKPT